MSTKIEDLATEMIPLAEAFVAALNAAGVHYAITCTRRTVDEQVALFAQGRAPLEIVNLLRHKAGMGSIGMGDNTYHVTNCDGINLESPHQSGKAMDVVPEVGGKPVWPHVGDPRWKAISQIGIAVGLEWGGHWPDFPDNPHYQMN